MNLRPDDLAVLPGFEVLPCGCRMATPVIDGLPTFVFAPCYAYVLDRSRALGKPVDLRYMDGV